MAFIVGAAIIGGTTLASGLIGSSAAKSSARAQERAAQLSTDEQRRQYDQTRADFMPWRDAGIGALDKINALNGGDFSGFYSSPDYEFTRREGQRGMEQSAAARGGAFSGNALRGLSEYNQGLASQQFGNYYNRLAGVAGVGQAATGSIASAGANASNNISNNLMAAGNARASGIMGAANSWTGALNSGMNNMLLGMGGYFKKV